MSVFDLIFYHLSWGGWGATQREKEAKFSWCCVIISLTTVTGWKQPRVDRLTLAHSLRGCSPHSGGTWQSTCEGSSSIRKPGDKDWGWSFLVFPPSSNQDFSPQDDATRMKGRNTLTEKHRSVSQKNYNLIELTMKIDHGGCLDAKVWGVPMVPRPHYNLRSAP